MKKHKIILQVDLVNPTKKYKMAQIEIELQQLKSEVISMWTLVRSQLNKSKNSLLHFDRNLAREVIIKEKRVNGLELKIDRDCEHIFALFSPVAVDLRFVLAVLKINSSLERIGDTAEHVSNFIIRTEQEFSADLLQDSKVIEMLEMALSILDDALKAFETENTILARSIFQKDEFLNEVNINAIPVLMEFIKTHPDEMEHALIILSIIRKVERIGDHTKNMAEEMIFYVEAKVLKHNKDLNK